MYMYFFLLSFSSPPTFQERNERDFTIVSNISLVASGVTPVAGTMPRSFQHAALPNRPDPPRDTSSAKKGLI